MNISTITKISGKVGAALVKRGPELLIGGGIVAFGGAIGMTIKATTDFNNRIVPKYEVETIKIEAETPDAREINKIKYEFCKDTVVAYTPAFILCLISLGCFIENHNLMKKRNVAIVCAYKVLNDSFKNYRTRVIEEYGEDVDYRFKNNLTTSKITEIETDEDGKKKKKKVDVDIITTAPTGYSYIFDDKHYNGNITDVFSTRVQLEMAQESANVILKTRGYITLNEVLRSIGLSETTEGAVVGWQMKGDGDGFVDFRMKQVYDAENPGEVVFMLDFNVDGLIYQDIDKYTRAWGE